MAKPLSEDLRRRVVVAIEGGATIPEVAEQCEVSISSVGRFTLRANDRETSESLKFSLWGEGQFSRGHAKQRRSCGRWRRGWRGGRPQADRSASPVGGGVRDVGSASASDFYGADEAAYSGGD